MASPAMWSRRQAVAALAAASGAALLPGCDTTSEPMRPSAAETDTAALRGALGDVAVRALALAALAPSGHNAQPWTVEAADRSHWRIGLARERLLPAVDPTNREAWLSIGAFVENFAIAAQSFGLAVEAAAVPGTDVLRASDATVDVRLRADVAVPYPERRLRERRTVRSGHAPQPLAAADRIAITEGIPGVHYFARDTAGARYLAEGTVDANRRQARRDDAQGELADWIRWNRDDERRHRNGLTPAGMEITGVAGWYVRTFFDRNSALKDSFRRQGVDQVVERVAQGAGWLVLTGDPSVAGLVDAGRSLERMWLRMRERRVAMHPMTQLLEETPNAADVAKSLGIDGVPQFVLRVGYVAEYPDPVSPRMPVSAFTRLSSSGVSRP
jgi:hypothetical protein